MFDFEKFDREINTNALQEQLKNAEQKEFPEIPNGEYNVRLKNIEVKSPKTNQNKLMTQFTFNIEQGAYKNKKIFVCNFIAGTSNDGVGIALCRRFIKALELEFDECDNPVAPPFTSYSNWNSAMMEYAEWCKADNYSYIMRISQREGSKYKNYEIVSVL